MKDRIEQRFDQSQAVVQAACEHLSGPIAEAAQVIIDACRQGGGVYVGLVGLQAEKADVFYFQVKGVLGE